MADMIYARARQQAKGIRAAYGVPTKGVSGLVRIASILGAEVFFEPLHKDQAGFIVKNKGEAAASIVINSSDMKERQRFTLAHEIGHLVDRHGLAGDPNYSFMDYRDYRKGYDGHEFFADEFAGELLMPAVDIINAVYRTSIYEAAALFGVTPAAVERRIARLKKHPPAEFADID